MNMIVCGVFLVGAMTIIVYAVRGIQAVYDWACELRYRLREYRRAERLEVDLHRAQEDKHQLRAQIEDLEARLEMYREGGPYR